MEVVDQFYNGYGEGAPQGRGPDQSQIEEQGNAYLEKGFPQLDYIKKATVQ
jgi:peptidyl-prolyl cis-trans isomerase A (cyclophilin A)